MAQVALQPVQTDGTVLPFEQVVFKSGDGEWAEFHKDITLPRGINKVAVVLYLEGTGKAWLDDMQVREIVPDNATLKAKQ